MKINNEFGKTNDVSYCTKKKEPIINSLNCYKHYKHFSKQCFKYSFN